jgi:hypothetical protein
LSDVSFHWYRTIGQTLMSRPDVPSLVKIHWRMLILECSQGCYMIKIWPGDLDLWPMTLKINRVQILWRTKHVPSLVKIHWRMLILECSQGCYERTDGDKKVGEVIKKLWSGQALLRRSGSGRKNQTKTICLPSFEGET